MDNQRIISLLTFVLFLTETSAEITCVDSNPGVQVADGSYPCSWLTSYNELDRDIGVYANRMRLCQRPETDCCASCRKLSEESVCVDDNPGVLIADGSYPCEWLTGYNILDRDIGIYANRVNICQRRETSCCASCKKVAEEAACMDNNPGVAVGDGSYPCDWLTSYNELDRDIGVYANRKDICQRRETTCCASCKLVANEGEPATTKAATSGSEAPTTARLTPAKSQGPTPAPLTDTCQIHCIQIADAVEIGSKCEWLLDPSSSVFISRQTICNYNMAPGCRKTCRTVLNNPDATIAQQNSPTAAPQVSVCTDSDLRLSKALIYSCSELIRPQSDVYSDRVSLCARFKDQCCQTCKIVKNEKPSSEIKYNGGNDVNINGGSTVVVVDDVIVDTPNEVPAQTDKNILTDFNNVFQRQIQSFVRKHNEEKLQLQKVFNSFAALLNRFFNKNGSGR